MRTIVNPGRSWSALVVLSLLVVGSTALQAQGAGPERRAGPQQMDRRQLERQVAERFEGMVQAELGLDSATAGVLFDAVEAMHGERRELMMREGRLRRQLAGTGVYLSDPQSRAALAELIAIKREEVRLLERETERLGEILTPPQLLRFYVLREELGERIRRLQRDRGPGSGSAPVEAGPYPNRER